jgi:tetratricopeptide (TPR) repeat protein
MSQVVREVSIDAGQGSPAGRLVEAEQLFQFIPASDPRHVDSMHLLAFIAYRAGSYQKAAELVASAIRLRPDNPAYHSTMGNILFAQRKIDEAAERYQHAVALKPNYAEAHNNLGIIRKEQGNCDDAVRHYEQAIALKPDFADAHNNLGVALGAQGRIADAAVHYERAIALDPGHANAHHNLGKALYGQRRFDEAVKHYKRVLVLNPGHANTHYALGVALKAQGRVEGAVTHYRRALAINPEHAEAHNNLANILVDQNKLDDAITHYRRALAINPDSAEAHYNLANVLRDQDKPDDAIAHCRRALAISPDSAEAHYSLGSIFKIEGKLEAALTHYGRAIAIRPDYAEVHFSRAELKTFHRGDDDLAALERLADRNNLSAAKAPYIHFALAKALEDTAEYGRAFEHLRKGNAAKRRQVNYDERSVSGFFQRISTVFDRRLFDRFQGAGDPAPAPVFVLGMPRSGSSLIEQILASHPQIHGSGELKDLETAASNILNACGRPTEYPKNIPSLDSNTLQRIGQAYLARLPAPAGKVRIIDKLPGNFFHIGLIRLVLPNARIIHTMRHPMDTCMSCYSKLFTSGQYFSYELAELGRFYRRYSALMSHWRSVLPPDAILDVSYEDVVDDLEGQARRLIDYCGLPWDDRCLAFHRTSRPVKTASAVQVRKPLFRSSLQRWRRHEAQLAPLLRELGELIPGRAFVQSSGMTEAQNPGELWCPMGAVPRRQAGSSTVAP